MFKYWKIHLSQDSQPEEDTKNVNLATPIDRVPIS